MYQSRRTLRLRREMSLPLTFIRPFRDNPQSCPKNCTPLLREAHFEVKVYKAHQLRTTFGSWDVEKVHAVVARSTFPSQNAQNTRGADHFWQLRCRKSARRCGAKHISKSKCTKHEGCGPLLAVEMSKKCTPLWREAHLQVKMHKALHSTTLNYTTLHYITLHYTTLHYTTLPSTTLHYITLHYTTLQLQLQLHSTTLHHTSLHSTTLNYTTLHYITLHYTTLHYITLHYTTLSSTTLHYITLHYTPLHYNYNYTTTLHYTPLHSTKLNYTTLHYITLHYIPLHCITLHYITLNDTAPQIDR